METKAFYVGRCPGCNAILAGVLINPDHLDRASDCVAEMIKEGLVVERSLTAPTMGECCCKAALGSFTYIGSKPCGCVPFAVVDNPKDQKGIAKDLAYAVRNGLAIERISTEDARNRIGYCDTCKAVRGATAAPRAKRAGRPTWDDLRAEAGKVASR